MKVRTPVAIRAGASPESPKMVFMKRLRDEARELLCPATLPAAKIRLRFCDHSMEQIRVLDFARRVG